MFTPLYWLLVCLLLVIFLRPSKWKRLSGWLALVVFIIFSSPALFTFYARWWQPKPVVLSINSHYSFAIVAGGFGSVDEAGNGYFNGASDRFLQAVKLYHTGSVDRILISGGNSKKNNEGFTEAAWAKGEMLAMGVPGSVVFIEDASDGTRGNALNSKRILDSLNARPPFVLVTSAFHIPRAKKIFEQVGLAIIAFPCNYTEGRGPVSFKDVIPDPALLVYWSKYIKETLWWVVKG